MTLLLSALTIGLILSLLGLGVYISFRIFNFADITPDGSLTTGGALAAILITQGISPVWATLAGGAAGFLAGTLTGVLHTRFKIHALLSGILVMTALYSVNLHIMGRSNVPLVSLDTLASRAESWGLQAGGFSGNMSLMGRFFSPGDLAVCSATFIVMLFFSLLLYFFLRTNMGTAMRATGDNQQMITALGVNVAAMTTLGLALSNGLIGISGALLAQYQGFADVQMGIGMVVWGIASVIIGEALVGQNSGLGLRLTGAVIGSVLFRLLVAIALRWGLNPNDLKLITAVFVLVALVTPGLMERLKGRKSASKREEAPC
ncbi:MAG: ABC transporter permease [Lentisphaerae bacterium GWF2_52_8]|nr:MAG: ABC transporter permease [Lentisphaerae bacterium GWF2_52_8]